MPLLKVLVYWLEENNWSVVSHTALRDERALPGTSTFAKYGGKWYPALIVAKNYQEEYIKKEEKSLREFVNIALAQEDPKENVKERLGKTYPIHAKDQSKDIEGEKQITDSVEGRKKTTKRKLESGLIDRSGLIEGDSDGDGDGDQLDSLLSPVRRNNKTKKRLGDTTHGQRLGDTPHGMTTDLEIG